MFLAHPIFGVWFGTYRISSLMYVPAPIGGQLHAHNLYLQLLAETGIVGFLALVVPVGASFVLALKLVKHPDPMVRIVGVGVCGAITATLIHGMVDFIFLAAPQFGALFWLVLGLCIAVSKNSLRSQPGVVNGALH
jgi:putative inorganic carbon (HCO3(-)) transporter